MAHRHKLLLWLAPALLLGGCRLPYGVPQGPMPPNTVLLSQVLRELSAKPGFTEALLTELNGAAPGHSHEKRGPALLTPRLFDELRKRILGKDWQALDRFPGWTMREVTPAVHVADHVVGGSPRLEGATAVHPGAPAPALTDREARTFLDLGPYSLEAPGNVALDTPSTLSPFTTDGLVSHLGDDLTRGDGPNDLAPEHPASQRLAFVLNRLSANALPGARPFRATLGSIAVSTPEGLVALLASTGHQLSVTDSRYFANFGHLHYKGQDVMMPFWMDTGMAVPGTGGLFQAPRPLLIPVSHAELEWHVRGPSVNADVSHYFGVDGKAEWRTMDTLDQAWVLKRNAHTYTGADAEEVTRLAGLITLAYMHQHARRPQLPFGGYFALGVCQDPVSAVETRMHGRSTLFPNTADSALFDDPRDAEVNTLFARIPKDRDGAPPQPERIFGSLPLDPGPEQRFSATGIPGLAPDLQAAFRAWRQGTLGHVSLRLNLLRAAAVLGLAAAAAALLGAWYRKQHPRP